MFSSFMEMMLGMKTDDCEGEAAAAADYSCVLPEGCIAHIISLTTPRDACRLCLVSPIFRSAADSDAVWDRFLPPDCLSLLSPPPPPSPSKKHLFLSLCRRPVLIDRGTKSFSLDPECGKKCYMLSARSLSIVWGDTPSYWRWISLPEAKFADVAELVGVCWFEIRGKIDVSMLSPSTMYSANLVFKSTMSFYGFEHQPVEATIGLVGGETRTRSVYLDSERGRRLRPRIVRRPLGLRLRNRSVVFEAPCPGESENERDHPKKRGDGWYEVELGEFFYDGKVEGELEMSALEVKGGDWKGGLVVQGIEVRPKKP